VSTKLRESEEITSVIVKPAPIYDVVLTTTQVTNKDTVRQKTTGETVVFPFDAMN